MIMRRCRTVHAEHMEPAARFASGMCSAGVVTHPCSMIKKSLGLLVLLMVVLPLQPVHAHKSAEQTSKRAGVSVERGAPCRILGQTRSIGKQRLRCEIQNGKARWRAIQGGAVANGAGKTPPPTPSTRAVPTPTDPTPKGTEATETVLTGGKDVLTPVPDNSLPAPSPTPNPLRVSPDQLSLAERWNRLDPSALEAVEPWINRPLSNEHTVDFRWKSSANADSAVFDEIKRRYDATARFWTPYVKVVNPLLVVVGTIGEQQWMCEEKHRWFGAGWVQPDCISIHSKHSPTGTVAGQGQIAAKNIDHYLVDTVERLEEVGFRARIQHEYAHNVLHARASNYHGSLPCWMMEGGAEYLGILAYSHGDRDRFLSMRNHAVQKSQYGMARVDVATWEKYLLDADRSDVVNLEDGDSCSPVRGEIYTHAVLANEYLVGRLGLPGYLDLVGLTGSVGWESALQRTFSTTRRDLYRQMALYMMEQYDLIISNPWSYQHLTRKNAGN
jgi:hypothetical protein